MSTAETRLVVFFVVGGDLNAWHNEMMCKRRWLRGESLSKRIGKGRTNGLNVVHRVAVRLVVPRSTLLVPSSWLLILLIHLLDGLL